MAADLTTEEADAYAVAQRRDIMTNVGVIFDLSERAEQGDLCPVGSGRRWNRREASVAFENGTGSKRSGSFAAGSIYICGEYHARRGADGTESGKQHLRLHS